MSHSWHDHVWTGEWAATFFFAYEWCRLPQWNFQEYRIPSLTFWYVLQGNRRLCAAGQEITVEPGQFVVLRRGTVVSTSFVHGTPEPFYYFSLGLWASIGGIDWTEALGIPTRFPIPKGEELGRLLALWRELAGYKPASSAGEVGDTGAGSALQQAVQALALEARLKLWLALITEAAIPFMHSPRPAWDPRVRKLCDYMREHLAEPVQAQELSQLACLSEGQMRTIFRQATGLSPHQYLIHLRLDKVKELLVTTELPLSEIAGRTGFDSMSYLISLFRRREGVTPIMYRRKGPAWEAQASVALDDPSNR